MSAQPLSVDALDDSVRSALRRRILTLADSKRMMGMRYSDWLLGSPSLETGIAASAMAQDEWGHARLLYAMLKEFGDDPGKIEHDRAPEDYASSDALDEPLPDWAALVAAAVIVDGALTVALRSLAGTSFELAATRVPKMLAEESFHIDFAQAWFRRLAAGSEEGRQALRSAVDAMMGRTLAWLCPDDDSQAALEGARLSAEGAELRRGFSELAGPTLATLGVDVTAAWPDRGGWDEVRGRGPGHPGLEAVERARGDLNRALFVE